MNSKQKGKRGELEWAQWLKDRYHDAQRGVQYKGSVDSPDVISDLENVHFEVKRTEKLRIYEAFEQADKDAGEDKIPVVAYRKSRKDWLIIMDASHWLRMIEKYNEFLNKSN